MYKADAGEIKIPHAQITRITVEDHYSRILFASGNGDDLRNVLIRLPLKKLLQALPKDAFVQIHRSHAVNLRHVKCLEKPAGSADWCLTRTEWKCR